MQGRFTGEFIVNFPAERGWKSIIYLENSLFQIQQSKMTAAQLSTDYRGEDFTCSMTVGNPNLITNSGVIVGHYLQSVTEKLALGTEIAYREQITWCGSL